jgi:uncharacterized RDD family membrane protein YckC
MSPETPVQTVLACSQCGRSLAPSELVHVAGNWVCVNCKPAFLSRMMASGAAPSAVQYGGFWIRFGARILDGIIVGIPFMIVAALLIPNFLRTATQGPATPSAAAGFAAFGLTFVLLGFLAGACYEVLMLKYRSATLGKMSCGLKVVRPDGGTLSWGVCFGRFFMWNIVTAGIPYLNVILMSVSSIMVGADEEKRALHDRVCDTRVIYNRA